MIEDNWQCSRNRALLSRWSRHHEKSCQERRNVRIRTIDRVQESRAVLSPLNTGKDLGFFLAKGCVEYDGMVIHIRGAEGAIRSHEFILAAATRGALGYAQTLPTCSNCHPLSVVLKVSLCSDDRPWFAQVADLGVFGLVPQYSVPVHPGASLALTNTNMASFPRRDTAPELALRRQLHALGLRYRVQYPVPGLPRRKIDVAFTRYRVAVFVDGCFWHSCPLHGSMPKSNSDWWALKLAAIRSRDKNTNESLERSGWVVLRIWTHVGPEEATQMVLTALESQQCTRAVCIRMDEA